MQKVEKNGTLLGPKNPIKILKPKPFKPKNPRTTLLGTLETVRGRGVVGQEPVLDGLLPAFQYSSHVSLQAPSGHMWGTFKMERENRETFECRIPPFTLESKHEGHNGDGSGSGSTQGAGPYKGQEPVLDI